MNLEWWKFSTYMHNTKYWKCEKATNQKLAPPEDINTIKSDNQWNKNDGVMSKFRNKHNAWTKSSLTVFGAIFRSKKLLTGRIYFCCFCWLKNENLRSRHLVALVIDYWIIHHTKNRNWIFRNWRNSGLFKVWKTWRCDMFYWYQLQF